MDIASYRIPNYIPFSVLVLFAVWAAFGSVGSDWVSHILWSLPVLGGVIVLFSMKMFGGGDAKLLWVVALWIGPDLILEYLFLVGLLGGLEAALILIFRLVKQKIQAHRTIVMRLERIGFVHIGGAIPYGVAISAAGLVTVLYLR